jgi:hypothetical protein
MIGVIFLTGLWAASVVLKQDSILTEEIEEVYSQVYYSNTSSDEIVLEYPLAEQIISSPLTVRGKARGSWFFEASAPVVLTDWDGRMIAQGVVQTKGDWMTSEFVPFEGTLTFETPSYGDTGALILQNDNPSGLSSNDKALEISIRYR